MPEYQLSNARSAGAVGGTVFISESGVPERYVIGVTRDVFPGWVWAIVDDKLGKGYDDECAVEEEPDGWRVFHVKRIVNRRTMQIGIVHDRTIRYIEREVEEKDVPEAVRKRAMSLLPFRVEYYAIRDSNAAREFRAYGTVVDTRHIVSMRADGSLVEVRKLIPGQLQVTTRLK